MPSSTTSLKATSTSSAVASASSPSFATCPSPNEISDPPYDYSCGSALFIDSNTKSQSAVDQCCGTNPVGTFDNGCALYCNLTDQAATQLWFQCIAENLSADAGVSIGGCNIPSNNSSPSSSTSSSTPSATSTAPATPTTAAPASSSTNAKNSGSGFSLNNSQRTFLMIGFMAWAASHIL